MITRVKKSAWQFRDNAGYVSLTDPSIGGIGDGVTDNTAAFNTALALNLPVFIPPGTFLIGSITVPTYATIFGVGDSCILKLKNSTNLTALNIGVGTNLFNFALDGNKANQLGAGIHGIKVTNGAQVTLEDLYIYNTLADGINITGNSTRGIIILGCVIAGFVKNGITVESGTNITINTTDCGASDLVASPGDGISLAPTSGATAVSSVTIAACSSHNNTGRGISILGNTSANVTDVTISSPRIDSCASHGIHLFLCAKITIVGGTVKACNSDGVRLEGDTQSSRVSVLVSEGNTSFGIREVTTGATPNLNGLIYNVSLLNGNNTITKVGAGSFVV